MKTIITALTGLVAMTLAGQAAAWAHANSMGGSTSHSYGSTSHTNAYGGSTSHAYGEGTEHTNAYGGSTAHGWDGGTTHTNVAGGTTTGAYGAGAVHTTATGYSTYHPPYPATGAYAPYHPPVAVPYYAAGCYNCGGAAAAGAVVGMAAGAAIASANTAAATSNAYAAGVATGSANTAVAYSSGYAAGATTAAPAAVPVAGTTTTVTTTTTYGMGMNYAAVPAGSILINKNGTHVLPQRQYMVPARLRRQRRLLPSRSGTLNQYCAAAANDVRSPHKNKPDLSKPRSTSMKRNSRASRIVAAVAACVLAGTLAIAPAVAQVVTGVLGQPSATVTIEGNQIPPPPMKFGGVIKESATESTQWWPPRVVPPKGAPNVLLIMTDDQGYGVSGTFGGVIATPSLDRVAKAGLRYTHFHSTALCSPTRAALITGRNHHSVGSGVIGELSTGYPGYDSIIGPENASIGTILRDSGFATSWFGKNHNTPTFQYSAAGPFDQWPSGMGFQYFYGFMGGETDQWTPYLFRDHTQIFPWVGKPGYNLTTDLADEAIKYMSSLNAAAPDQPFFLYYVPGGTHSPHQPKKEWVEKFKGKFDMGYEKLREQIFANQKRLGVIPANTQLTPWPAEIPKWETLSVLRKEAVRAPGGSLCRLCRLHGL